MKNEEHNHPPFERQPEGERAPRRHPGHGPHPDGERHPGRRNFWHDWHDQRHPHGRRDDLPQIGQALSPAEMEAWRDFFRQSFGTNPEDHWVFGARRFSPWHQGIDTFNPFVATLLSKGGGLLPLYVLHLVAKQPRYGNEIMDRLAERTNGQWVANPGAIYPLLAQMEHEGFIKGEWQDPEKRSVRLYTILPAGQAELARIETIVAPKIAETIQVLQDLLDDLTGSDSTPGSGSAGEEAL